MSVVTFGVFSSKGSAIGVAAPIILLFGTLATPRTFGAGDQLTFAAGALTVVLS